MIQEIKSFAETAGTPPRNHYDKATSEHFSLKWREDDTTRHKG